MQCIYGVSEGYIQQYSPETEGIFRPRPINSRGHGLLPEGIYWPRTKKARGRGGYIVVYSLTRPHIYNIYTTSELKSLWSRFISVTFLLKTYYEVEYQISSSVVNYIVIPFINKKVKSNRLGLLTLVIAHLEMKISLHICLFLYSFTFDKLPLVKFLPTYCIFTLESSKNVQFLK